MKQIVTIEKGIPIPSRAEFGSIRAVLEKMKVGDSVPNPAGIPSSWYPTARLLGMKIAFRKRDGVRRVWRVK